MKIPIVLEQFTETEIAAFWSLVYRCSPKDCWPWLGHSTESKGFVYGVWVNRDVSMKAHRVAWVLGGNILDPALTIDHSYAKGCRNKLCCNVAHMDQVTQAENTLRQFRDPERLYTLIWESCGHIREFGRQNCRKCMVIRVAKSQANNPEKYLVMKREQKRRERARKQIQISAQPTT